MEKDWPKARHTDGLRKHWLLFWFHKAWHRISFAHHSFIQQAVWSSMEDSGMYSVRKSSVERTLSEWWNQDKRK